MSNIRTSLEGKRGCGWRKEGGLYLVLPEFGGRPCGKLPLPLDRCPCCGGGIKFARGWTWVDGKLLFKDKECQGFPRPLNHERCILDDPPEKMGLIWIGEKFYETPEDWLNEGRDMGVSRRIKNVPKGFKIGETWVAVAHIEAIPGTTTVRVPDLPPPDKGGKKIKEKVEWWKLRVSKPFRKEKGKPAIFQVFKPSAIEYVVKGTETEEELTKLEEYGISLVKVVKIEEKREEKQAELPVTQETTD